MSRLETLLANVRSSDWSISVPAARELRHFATDPRAVTELTQALLQQEDLLLSLSAAQSLEFIADPQTIPALAAVLTNDSLEQELRACSDHSYQNGDYGGLAALAEHFGGDILDLKCTLARALVRINTPQSYAALEAAREDPDPYHLISYAIDHALKNTSNPAP